MGAEFKDYARPFQMIEVLNNFSVERVDACLIDNEEFGLSYC